MRFTFPVKPRRLRVAVETSTYVTERVQVLLELGLFGIDREHVIEELIRARLLELEVEGWFGKDAFLADLHDRRKFK